MKTVKVVAAVICDSLEDITKIFATARGYGDFKGQWEFPGGKVETGEGPRDALKREIREELTAEIEVGSFICTVEHDYPTFHLSMDCFWAQVKTGELVLKEAEDARWLGFEDLDSVEWLPADLKIIEYIRERMDCPWYKDDPEGKVWWLDNGRYRTGEHIFSFDRKTEFNLFADYPYCLSKEQVELFDKENPFWADFFKERKMETFYYIVESIESDYANLRRTDIESDDLKLVARALLPPEIMEGTKLKYEMMQYSIIE